MEKTTMNVIKNDGPISADQVKTQGLTENNEKAMKFEEEMVEKQKELTNELQDVRREWLLKHQNQLIKEINISKEQLKTELFENYEKQKRKEINKDVFLDLYRRESELIKLLSGQSDMEKRTLVLMIERMLEMITKEKRYQHNYLR